MSQLGLNPNIIGGPNYRQLGEILDELNIRKITVSEIIITTTLNGIPISDLFPSTDVISTTDATLTTLSTIPISNNTAVLLTVDMVVASLAGDSAVIRQSYKVTNNAGTVTLSAAFDMYSIIDAALAAITVSFVVSTTDVLIRVTGIAATNINWSATRITKTLAF